MKAQVTNVLVYGVYGKDCLHHPALKMPRIARELCLTQPFTKLRLFVTAHRQAIQLMALQHHRLLPKASSRKVRTTCTECASQFTSPTYISLPLPMFATATAQCPASTGAP